MIKLLLIFIISNTATASISEVEFKKIADEVLEVMSPEIEKSRLSISLNLNWKSDLRNAGANRSGRNGVINLYGGYARLDSMTNLAFAKTVCHELGHLVADDYRVMPTLKYASESEADYFSTSTCMKKYLQVNPTNRRATDWQLEKCNQTSSLPIRLCSDLLITARDSLIVDQELTPNETWEDYTVLDRTETKRTLYNDYASVGCRYTSYVHGALSLERPSCWLQKKSSPSESEYEPDYEYPESMFVGVVGNIESTHFGCNFDLMSISFFRESRLASVSMSDLTGESIKIYGRCPLKSGDDISGTITEFKSNFYYNLESRDK